MGHATIEWVYVGVVISLLTWVGAESWNVERQVEHVPPSRFCATHINMWLFNCDFLIRIHPEETGQI